MSYLSKFKTPHELNSFAKEFNPISPKKSKTVSFSEDTVKYYDIKLYERILANEKIVKEQLLQISKNEKQISIQTVKLSENDKYIHNQHAKILENHNYLAKQYKNFLLHKIDEDNTLEQINKTAHSVVEFLYN